MFAAHPSCCDSTKEIRPPASRAKPGRIRYRHAVQLIDLTRRPRSRHAADRSTTRVLAPRQQTRFVGQHLIASVAEVLGAAVTPEVAVGVGARSILLSRCNVAERVHRAAKHSTLRNRLALFRVVRHRGNRRRRLPPSSNRTAVPSRDRPDSTCRFDLRWRPGNPGRHEVFDAVPIGASCARNMATNSAAVSSQSPTTRPSHTSRPPVPRG